MSRKLIPNVDQLYEKPSDNYMFCSCMSSAMAAIDGNGDYDFLFFAGTTGDLFMQIWCEPKWQYNDSYSTVCRDSQVPIKAAFDACGYEYEYIYREEIQKNKPEYIRKIVESIDKGLPVLTFGIVGPPICSIICGYDENGEKLIGWSQFTDKSKEDNQNDLVTSKEYFQVRNGLARSKALIFFTKKKNTPSIAESIKKSILNIPKLASLPSENNRYFAGRAFEAWADSLLCDEYFQNENMLGSPLDTYGSCIVMLGTNMHFMQKYLDRALKAYPEISEQIQKLKQAYEKENEALQRLINFQGGYFFDADRNAILSKNYRIQLAKIIRQVGQCYEEAANVINE